jgi:ureidoglycolate hydrolase
MFILGMHIGGIERRGTTSQKFIPFAAQVDYLIVRTDGNADGFFTNVAKEKQIPLFLFEKSIELVDILKEISEGGKAE